MTEGKFTIGSILREKAHSVGNRDALVFPDSRLTHEELYGAATSWARTLAALGVDRQDHVGILLPTCPEFVEVLAACALLGAVTVPINARYQPGELAYLVKDAGLRVLVTTGEVSSSLNFEERLHSALPSLAKANDPLSLDLPEAPSLRQVICLEDECGKGVVAKRDAMAFARKVNAEEIDRCVDEVKPADTALILYTSGTTSEPKGCVISNRAIVGNSRNLGRRYEVTGEDKVWSPLPIYHIAGILPMMMILDAGGAYLTVSYFDAGTALEMLEREGATIAYPTFVTIMQDLISHEKFSQTDLSTMRLMNSNFAVQPAWIKDAMIKAMPSITHVGTFGLTEAAGTICTSRLDESLESRTTRLGVPLDEWEVRIVDMETGKECGTGERGEICARGPNMLDGYYNSPEKTADCIRDGWLHTGDIGSLDENGTIMFHGRTKDMLKVGGENVAAAEIENALQSHDAVKLAQIVGIPDDRYVEVPVGFIELAKGKEASEQELIDHCRGKIANFKLPRAIRFVSEWPMSTSKIQKFRLREDYLEELEGK
ncbi:class I adenylate-forming enzyme family protein [Aurantiacibacter odishensis]|uniref:class I adenylate-forming enzyme family protein n=1 Tax=Aurantiacibacter odishensis TaxID=1155476 RepID=UPI000E76C888|nr:class I adenylate-forming enzyme family protein [Aurantiacibacter odishensis]